MTGEEGKGTAGSQSASQADVSDFPLGVLGWRRGWDFFRATHAWIVRLISTNEKRRIYPVSF